MENATKALIIAAAVLVAIIIITLTLGVVNQGREAMQGADMSDTEKETYNQKFLQYEGTNVPATTVNALLNTILTSNQNEADKNSTRNVTVDGNAGAAVNTNNVTKVQNGNYYNVTCNLDNGLVTSVTINNR